MADNRTQPEPPDQALPWAYCADGLAHSPHAWLSALPIDSGHDVWWRCPGIVLGQS